MAGIAPEEPPFSAQRFCPDQPRYSRVPLVACWCGQRREASVRFMATTRPLAKSRRTGPSIEGAKCRRTNPEVSGLRTWRANRVEVHLQKLGTGFRCFLSNRSGSGHAVSEPYQNSSQAYLGSFAERRQTPQVVEKTRNRKRYWREFGVLLSRGSPVRVRPRLPMFFHDMRHSRVPERP